MIKKKVKELLLPSFLFLASFIFRLYLFPYKTHGSDMWFWKTWGKELVEKGTINFYTQSNPDYLPFYPLILALIQIIYNFYKFQARIIFIPIDYFFKFPAAFFDILAGIIIFKIVKQKSLKLAYFVSFLFLFNPAFFVNSSMWGQVDIVGTFFIILALYFFLKDKFFLTGMSIAVALCTKTIYLLAIPVFLISFWLKKNFKKNWRFVLKKTFIFTFGLIIIAWLINAPFTAFKKVNFYQFFSHPIILLFNRYQVISQRYPYNSVNAFNFWGVVNKAFWLSDDRKFSFFSYRQWGILLNSIVIFLSLIKFILLFKFKGEKLFFYRFNLILAVSFVSSFIFLTRIHERHLYYGLPFLLIAAIYNYRLFIAYFIFSIIYVLNLHFALEYYYRGGAYIFDWRLINLLSLGNLLLFIWIFIELFFLNPKNESRFK